MGLIRPSLGSRAREQERSGVQLVIKCVLVVCEGYPIGLDTNRTYNRAVRVGYGVLLPL